MTLVDTNVLLDVFTNDPVWVDWSIAELEAAAVRGRIMINDVVYAELSARFATVEALDAYVNDEGLVMGATPRAALFLAGKACASYRRAGGTRTGVLPDFFIGAHAVVLACPLLTRDRSRYRSYFPTIELVCPPA